MLQDNFFTSVKFTRMELVSPENTVNVLKYVHNGSLSLEEEE